MYAHDMGLFLLREKSERRMRLHFTLYLYAWVLHHQRRAGFITNSTAEHFP
jgi:hypothetical protein